MHIAYLEAIRVSISDSDLFQKMNRSLRSAERHLRNLRSVCVCVCVLRALSLSFVGNTHLFLWQGVQPPVLEERIGRPRESHHFTRPNRCHPKRRRAMRTGIRHFVVSISRQSPAPSLVCAGWLFRVVYSIALVSLIFFCLHSSSLLSLGALHTVSPRFVSSRCVVRRRVGAGHRA